MPALEKRIAIVTGASSGIGKATSALLAGEGAAVVLAARRVEELERLKQEIHDAGGRAVAVPTDVTNRDDVKTLVEATIEFYGTVDILVNNAGVMPLAPMRSLLVDEWDEMIDVNVRGLLYCVAAVLPTMLGRKSGHIVNIGSVAGRRPFHSGVVYSATKFAVRAISAGLREELSPTDNIRVTDVQPGVVETELMEHTSDARTSEQFAGMWAGKQKLDSGDVARAILYALVQPVHVNVNELLVRPTHQAR